MHSSWNMGVELVMLLMMMSMLLVEICIMYVNLIPLLFFVYWSEDHYHDYSCFHHCSLCCYYYYYYHYYLINFQESFKVTLRSSYDGPQVGISYFAWSPDSTHLAICGPDETADLNIWNVEVILRFKWLKGTTSYYVVFSDKKKYNNNNNKANVLMEIGLKLQMQIEIEKNIYKSHDQINNFWDKMKQITINITRIL